MKITEETTLAEVLALSGEAMKVLARHGFHTLSCPSEIYEPLISIAQSRGIPIDHLIADLQAIDR